MAKDKKQIMLVGLRVLCDLPSFYIFTRYFLFGLMQSVAHLKKKVNLALR